MSDPHPDPPPSDEPMRVLRLLQELHRRGHRRSRLHCGWSPNGMAWRYGIAPLREFDPDGLHMREDRYPGRAFKSTRGDGPILDLPGSERMSTEDLADLFTRTFRRVAREGRGADVAYARWLDGLVAACEPDGIPIMYAEFFDVRDDGVVIDGRETSYPLPPGWPV